MTGDQLDVLEGIVDSTLKLREDILIHQWYQNTIIAPPGNALPTIDYEASPFWIEPVNCFHPHHPARDITIMSIAQGGKSMMVIYAAIAYTIRHNPQHMMLLTGTTDLTKDAMNRLDLVLQSCDLRDYLGATVEKARNNRTGDTIYRKEFRGRQLIGGSITNHNMMRQNEAAIVFADDLDAGEISKEGTGGTVKLIKGRTKAHKHHCKHGWISSPQVKGRSLIEAQYNLSDKRLWYVPCQRCHRMITMQFSIPIDGKETAGLTWKLDNFGRVIEKSVHYVCQLCGQGFTDKNKRKFLNDGFWKPQTLHPLELNHYGYHLNGLYTPDGMTSWFDLAVSNNACDPPGGIRNEGDYQVHLNLERGELYEPPGANIEFGRLERNIRDYSIGLVPEKLSMADGNGRVVMLTCAADLGGKYIGDQRGSKVDDARLDWEIVAHTESGSTYSVDHGSIGTFQPAHMGKQDESRELWSYDPSKPNNVWKEFIKILDQTYPTDTGRKMRIVITGIDTGFCDNFAWSFIDRFSSPQRIMVGLKGDKEHRPVTIGIFRSNFKQSSSRVNLYTLIVGQLKDQIAGRIRLSWDRNIHQPPGFMNFPQRANGKYERENFFAHYESEERREDKQRNFIWQKKTTTAQNHMFDVAVYNMAVKEILMHKVIKDLGGDPKTASWYDFTAWLLQQYKLNSALPAK